MTYDEAYKRFKAGEKLEDLAKEAGITYERMRIKIAHIDNAMHPLRPAIEIMKQVREEMQEVSGKILGKVDSGTWKELDNIIWFFDDFTERLKKLDRAVDMPEVKSEQN